MKILEIDPFWDLYLIEHKNVRFQALRSVEEGRAIITTIEGWDVIAAETNEHPEYLLESLEMAIYDTERA